jgi:hypothetical protein
LVTAAIAAPVVGSGLPGLLFDPSAAGPMSFE